MMSEQDIKPKLNMQSDPKIMNGTINYENHEQRTAFQLANYFINPDYSDVTFEIDTKQLLCHKIILASRCSYFDKMFKSELTVSNKIEITTMRYEIFNAIVKFIYTGKVVVPHDDDGSQFERELLETGDMMDFDDIKEVISTYFISKMTPSNCIGFHTMASTYRAKLLQAAAKRYVLKHFEYVTDKKEFLDCSVNQLRYFLGDRNINSTSEEEICFSMLEWLKHKPSERANQISNVLPVLRLTTLSPAFIQFHLLRHPVIIDNKDTVELLQGILHHIWFLKPVPLKLTCGLPRTKTEIVTGLALFWHNMGKMTVSLYAISDDASDDGAMTLQLIKVQSSNCTFKIMGGMGVIDSNTVIVCGSPINPYSPQINRIYEYKVATKQWTCFSNFTKDFKLGMYPIIGEQRHLYGILYSYEIQSKIVLMQYSFEKDEWKVSGNHGNFDVLYVNQDNFTAFAHGNFLFIFGVALNPEDRNYRHIAAISLDIMNFSVLDYKLPEVLHHAQSIVHKDHVLIIENEKMIIFKLSALESEALEKHSKLERGDADDPETEKDETSAKRLKTDKSDDDRNDNDETNEESPAKRLKTGECTDDRKDNDDKKEVLQQPIVRPFDIPLKECQFIKLGNLLVTVGGYMVADPTKRLTVLCFHDIDAAISAKEPLNWFILGKIPIEIVNAGIQSAAVVRFYKKDVHNECA